MPGVLFLTLGLDLGGQSVHIANLGMGLIERGWTCAIATPSAESGAPLGREYFEERGIAVDEVPFSSPRAAGTRDQLRGVGALREVMDRTRPDIVHVHSVSLAPIARLAGRRLRPRPGLVSTFNNEHVSARRRRMARLSAILRVPPHPFGHRVIAISEALQATLVDLGIPAEVVRKIDYAVDDRRFRLPSPEERSSARARFGIPDPATVVGCVARVEPRKNQRVLIGALAELVREGHDLRLLVAGPDVDGHTEELRQQAGALGVAERVSFPGFVEPRDAYWASDINALVSTSEGFGLVVIEGMLCGVLALRSGSAGASDQIVAGETGCLVDDLSPHGVADAIRWTLAHPQEVVRINAAASEFARSRYGLARMADQVEVIYEEAMAVARRR